MAWPPSYYPQTRGFRFSYRELREIAISVLVLTLAFTIFFSDGIYGLASSFRGFTFAYYFVISLLAVLTAFFFHEMAHKFLAQKYGCWAEFNYSPMGLLFAIVTSLFGIIFAAPGAVIIGGAITREQNGRISAAGPGTNLLVGSAFTAAFFAAAPFSIPVFPSGPGLSDILRLLAWINIVLGGFNLIPFPPLDGSKILRWNLAAYVLLVVLAVGLFTVLFFF
ncbi:MAG: site-2 protease family protein [Thermoplasmata archaeon]